MVSARSAGVVPVRPTCLVPPPASMRVGEGDRGDHGEDHDHDGREEGAGAAALAQLASGDEPSLPAAVHGSTAWRNRSDRVGGW